MSDTPKPADPAAPAAKADEKAAPPKKKFNLQVKDLQLKQAPMEAVINRET
jgi:hypothetical protein